MATCNPTELLAAGKCFDCLDEGLKQTIKLQLLCEIANGAIRSYTLAELEAMSADQARAVGVAYCTDALNYRGVYGTTGVLALWDNGEWVDANRIRLASSFQMLALRAHQAYFGSTIPTATIASTGSSGLYTSGSGSPTQGNTAVVISTGRTNNANTQTGTSTNGGASRRMSDFPIDPTNAWARAQSQVLNHVTADQGTAGQDYWYRNTFEPPAATYNVAVPTDMIGLIYDNTDCLGVGVNSANFHAFVRANSTNLASVDTGIAYNVPHWQIVTIVPVSATEVEYAIATALNNGDSFTIHASGTVTVAMTSAQSHIAIAKTAGTTNKTVTTQIAFRHLAWRMNEDNPVTFVL